MKRFSLLGFGILGLMGSFLAGCPIFSDGDGSQVGCFGYGCGNTCTQSSDCEPGYTCETFNGTQVCVSSGNGGSGAGGATSTGGATSNGGSTVTTSSSSGDAGDAGGAGGATSSTSTATSTSSTSSGSTSSSGTSTSTSASSSSSSSGAAVIYCGHPSDCAAGSICGANGTCQPGLCSATNACILGYACADDGSCQAEVPGACDTSADCSNGDACIAGSQGGVCTAAANQCFDQSQCDAGEDCVNGTCVLACTSNAQCRDGYDCNTVTGVCTVVAQACTVTNDCGSATLVCVGGACVPRSTGGTCSNPNDVWDENGCVPNQQATFTCAVDGSQGACSAGSICLHHDCWISCDVPNQNACASQPTLNTCKPVVDNGTSYDVCGTNSNLGSQCGAGSPGNQTCSGGAVCIDGYCK